MAKKKSTSSLISDLKRKTRKSYSSEDEADYILELSVIKKSMGNRKGQLIVFDSNDKIILETKWVKGTSNAFYGYSGSRHAIGILVKKNLLKEFEEIVKEEE